MTKVELLPARKSYCRGAGFSWDMSTRTLATTTDKKRTCRYRVEEVSVPKAEGRCFRCVKLDAGTDPEGDSYTVLVGGRGDACDCRGFLRFGHCKHLDSVRSILAAGWWLAARPLPFAELVDAVAETWSGLWFEDDIPTEVSQ